MLDRKTPHQREWDKDHKLPQQPWDSTPSLGYGSELSFRADLTSLVTLRRWAPALRAASPAWALVTCGIMILSDGKTSDSAWQCGGPGLLDRACKGMRAN